MEVNDLKAIWKKANDQEKSGYWVSDEDMQSMLKQKSKATIADVVRQMRYKIRMSGSIGTLAVIIGLAHIFFIEPEEQFFATFSTVQYGIMMLFMSASILTICIHTWYRYRQVSNLHQSSHPLKHSLLRTKSIFQKLIRTNILTDSIVVPVVLVGGLALGYYSDSPFKLDVRLLYIVLAGAVSFGLLFTFAKFKMKRKLGGFINALNDRLSEIEALEVEDSETI